MPKKPRGKNKGLFRGPTPKGVFQTIDLGSGSEAAYLYRQAKRNPRRQYLAVNPSIDLKGTPKNLKVARNALRTIQNLAAQGKKARHIQIAMGTGTLLRPNYLAKIARTATRVLLPNGKIHFICHFGTSPEAFKETSDKIRTEGYSFRIVPATAHSFQRFSPKADAYAEQFRMAPWQYEFTLRLKKAVPEKEKRRKWPA